MEREMEKRKTIKRNVREPRKNSHLSGTESVESATLPFLSVTGVAPRQEEGANT